MKRTWIPLLLVILLLGCSPVSPPASATPLPPPPSSTPEPSPTPSETPTSSPTPQPAPVTLANVHLLSRIATLGQGEPVRSLDFSPDGQVLAAAHGNTEEFLVRLWRPDSLQPLHALVGHQGIVWDVAFSPDGTLLASSSQDTSVRVWDWLGNQLVQQFELPGEVATVVFSPDGTTLAAGGVEAWPEAAVWTWDVATWTARHHLREYWNITSLAFSPDGRWLVGGGTSRNMRVWQAASGDEQAVLYFPGQAGHLAFSPDGRLAASSTCLESAANSCGTPAVRIWDTDDWTAQTDISGFSEAVTGVEFSADGTLLFTASRDGRLRAYDPQDWGLVFEFDSGEFLMALDVSADGSQLATGSSAGAVSLYRLP